jgi:hypothetical protein
MALLRLKIRPVRAAQIVKEPPVRLVLSLALLALGALPLRAAPLDARVVATGAPLADLAALVAALEGADVVVIGEIHDNPRHQALQAQLIRALAPEGVAFEMVEAPDEAAVNAALAAGDLAAFPDLARYAEPLAATPPGRVVGAGQPRDRVKQAITSGAAAAFDGDAARFGLSAPLPAGVQKEMEAEMFTSHCEALPEAMLPGMVEGQRLRDAAFAAAALRARPGGGLSVLVAGDGHARTDRGVPAVLRRAAPGLKVVAVGQVERDGDEDAPSDPPPFDIVVVTDPAEREDPCARFAPKN